MQFGIFSVGDVTTDPTTGATISEHDRIRSMLAIARKTEEVGLDVFATGEYGFNALILGAWGIPVGLVTGDDALAAEVAEWLPWAELVVAKDGVGSSAAASVHPEAARRLIRAGARRAVQRAAAGELRTLEVAPPVTIEVDYHRPVQADFAALVPNAERVGDRTVRHVGPDAVTAYRGFLAGIRIATVVE